MNVLIIPSFFRNKYDKTLGNFFWEQALALKKAGCNVTILFIDTYSIKDCKNWLRYIEKKEEEQTGIKIYRDKALCPIKHHSGFYGTRSIFCKKIIELYNKYLKDIKIDVIHAHCCVWAGVAAKALAEHIHVPYVITEHSTLFGLERSIIKGTHEKAIREAFHNANKVICVSNALKYEIKDFCPYATVIGNVIDCDDFFITKKKDKDSEFKFFTLFYMKNLSQIQKKGFDILLDAFELLNDRYAKLLVGGGGEGENIIRQWIKEKGLEEKVLLLGYLSREQVVKNMQECDCFILPSRYETFGVVYAEAMSCGKPVIATKTGGPDGFVDEFSGILVEVEDKNELKNAMNYIMMNYEKYDPLVIRQRVISRFSMKAIAEQIIRVYEEVL